MGPEGIILVNPPITTCQQSLTHSALGFQTLLSNKKVWIESESIVQHFFYLQK